MVVSVKWMFIYAFLIVSVILVISIIVLLFIQMVEECRVFWFRNLEEDHTNSRFRAFLGALRKARSD